MRLRLRWIIGMSLVAVLGWRVARGWQNRVARFVHRIHVGKTLADTHTSQTYLLEPDAWLNFPLPPGGTLMRISTNANLPVRALNAPVPLHPRPGWRYALKYQFLDWQGQVLKEADYHHRTRMIRYRNPETGEVYTPSFYADPRRVPASTCTMHYALNRLPREAARFRVRLLEKDSEVGDVTVRIHCQEERTDYHKPYRWQRISRDRKEKMCRASVYTPDLISIYERQNLLRWMWSPLAPDGVEGRDYRRRTMYTLNETVGEEVEEAPMPAGLPVTPDRPGIVPLPSPPGHVRLACQWLEDQAAPPPGADVVVRWYGEGIHHRQRYQFTLTDDRQVLDVPTHGGLLEIQSSHSLAIQADWHPRDDASAEAAQDITPEPRFVRTYVAQPDHAVQYEIAHVDQCPTPLRVSLRHQAESWDAGGTSYGANRVVGWEFLAASGQVLDHGEISSSQPISRYDYVDAMARPTHVTEPDHYHFLVPPTVQRIRFQPRDDSVLVTCFSRPPDLEKLTRVPDDYQALPADEGQPSWFLMRPVDHLRMVDQRQSVSVRIQSRPPQDDLDLVAGRYQWESFHPRGLWRARFLLVPLDDDVPLHEDHTETRYCELATGRECLLRLFRVPGSSWIEPRLCYVNPTGESQRIQVLISGQPYHETTIRSTVGELVLPPLAVGPDTDEGQESSVPRRVTVRCSGPVRVFLSGADAPGRPAYRKRLAHRFDEKTLQFDYEKRGADREVLMLRWFTDPSRPTPTTVRVHILDSIVPMPRPRRDWTFTHRSYAVKPAAGDPAIILGTQNEKADSGQVCYIPLGQDLPAGHYTIRVENPQMVAGYVTLSRTIPGSFDERTILFEPYP